MINMLKASANFYLESTGSCLDSKESKGLNYCVKEEFVKIIQNMDSDDQFKVFDDVILEKQPTDLARILPERSKEFYLSSDLR